MDQIPQRAFISAIAKGLVEPAEAVPAKHATAFGVQRKTVPEGRAAVEAEEFGAQRRRLSQALVTNGDARKLAEGTFADGTLIRKHQRKKAIGDRAENRRDELRER
jgi:hypothetical protein